MGRMISLTAADTHHFAAYEAGNPDSKHAVVIVQEIFGLADHIKSVCDELASHHGYHVIAPALFDRAERDVVLPYDQAGMQKGLALRAKIQPEDLLADVTACAHALNKHGHEKVGIQGFCWGGFVAWIAATRTREFAASVAWYGGGIAQVSHEKPHCPVQLHFGGEDDHIPHTDVQKIRADQPDVEIYVYDDAGHGFGCPDRPSFNQAARDLAHERTMAFFKSHL
ncbi:carboxymethylenebutenolidase [Neoasaia chiangmaiensis NBRC 101099]|uniref:Carboxymethylenebutenolidase n=2 Tax=Neoasaia chiangmaiensis TaxID=320497 RepID=A0A1U9KTX2_9PROT|nr:dienelactone hydrolase family protein [Neoasaia chiangmaiensis]AQS89253.1 carboxymethylenebutenolidase [Neoasaia chiangmaiensis]GBR38144.1 carboxymethylenebutenolidase [Neoasaia chiangmaiensis NBRC 101099]GEN16022.1 carboxymethylenebutenolidase [Neoasaia chiangmaiensis]